MGKRGRKASIYTCPVCLTLGGPVRDGHGPYYDCSECSARLVMDNRQLRETRGWQKRVEMVETVEKKFYRMSADEFERFQS